MDDKASAELKNYIIQQWIDQNPPVAGNGWEPYPTSLRIVNWIKWALSGNKLSSEANQSLATQVRHLCGNIEYHLLGNHLFVNAKALVYAGLYFDGEEAQGWYRRGIEILIEQIPEQFLSDGAHFELSTTYHALLTEDLLDILQYMKNAGKEIDSLKSVSAVDAKEALAKNDAPVFDVRKDGEFQSEHLRNAHHTSLSELNNHLAEFPSDGTFYVHCAGGYRSVIAASILKSRGIHNLIDIDGGFAAMRKADMDITQWVCPSTLK